MHLAEDPGLRAPGLARVEKRVLGRSEERRRLERCVDRLDHAFDLCEPSFEDPGEAKRLLGEVLAAWEVDVCDLEERDVPVPRLHVAAGVVDQARKELGSQDRELDRDRLVEPDRGSNTM